MLYPKLKNKKTKLKKQISNDVYILKTDLYKSIKSLSSAKYFILFLKKSFHI